MAQSKARGQYSVPGWRSGSTKRTTPGLSDSKLLNSDDHGLNRRSESCVKGPQAIAIEKDVSRGSCFNPWLFEVDAVDGSKRGN